MAAYLIVDIDITNPEQYRAYQHRVPATYEPFGGHVLVRGGQFEVLEGEWQPRRVVMIEFPSLEQAKAWYASPAYRQIIPLRQQHAQANLVLVEGV